MQQDSVADVVASLVDDSSPWLQCCVVLLGVALIACIVTDLHRFLQRRRSPLSKLMRSRQG